MNDQDQADAWWESIARLPRSLSTCPLEALARTYYYSTAPTNRRETVGVDWAELQTTLEDLLRGYRI